MISDERREAGVAPSRRFMKVWWSVSTRFEAFRAKIFVRSLGGWGDEAWWHLPFFFAVAEFVFFRFGFGGDLFARAERACVLCFRVVAARDAAGHIFSVLTGHLVVVSPPSSPLSRSPHPAASETPAFSFPSFPLNDTKGSHE